MAPRDRELKADGVIRGFGISVNRWKPHNVLCALGTSLVDCVQVVYNVFDHDEPDDVDRGSMLYARGGLLCYTLDRELTGRGSNLDALMRRPYEERGLRRLTWRQSDLPALVEPLVGDPLSGFFDGLVATNARLPLDG